MPSMRFYTAVLAASFALSATPLGVAQLLPFGEFAARDGRPGLGKTWKINDEQGAALSAKLNAVAARTPIVIDYEHHTLTAADKGHLAIAAGWIKSTEWRAGEGLYANVEWTAAASARIEAKEYQFLSPIMTYDDTGNVTGVLIAGLVNYPAIVGMDAAMAAALSTLFKPDPPQEKHMELARLITLLGLAATATEQDVTTHIAALKAKPAVPGALVTALGLTAGADEVAALSAVTALKSADASVLGLVTTLQGQVAALSTQLNDGALTALVDGAIADKKFTVAQRTDLLNVGRKDMAVLSGLIASAVPIPGLAGQTGNKEREQPNTVALSATQSLIASQLGLDPAAYAKTLKAA